ncbi:MAG: hypothetical protein VXZ58_02055, partial [Actinomycetota bacterium]|nr:hypothetical protein [Actinomycetota bacterium]
MWLTGSELPEYRAELDPYCPRAQVRKYNQDKKLDAEEKASRVKNSTDFIKKKIHSSFEDVPLKMNPSLRAKATSAASSSKQSGGSENVMEVEILQKVIVRENLLEELKKLLANQTDVSGCLPEVIELVKAVRYQTVEIIEEISDWQAKQATRRAFLYRGINYLTKIFEDLSFLDLYEDIVAKFCFEFTGNPLGYRGGGDVVTGPGGNAQGEGMQRLAEFYNDHQGSFDGIEIVRLRNAERAIQMEFDRLDKEKKIFAKQQAVYKSMTPQQRAAAAADGSMAIGELGMGSVVDGGGSVNILMTQDELAAASISIQEQEVVMGNKVVDAKGKKVPRADPRKWRQKFNPKKVKMERIQSLTAEADELRAMETHLEDQINTLVAHHHDLADKRRLAEQKRREALSLSKDVAAQHITVEISMHTSDMQELNAKIKDLQRQIYFFAVERNRKRKVAKK